MSHAFVVPFRWKGTDERRPQNHAHILQYLTSLDLGPVIPVGDGRTGDEPFNRSAAMNIGDQLAWDEGCTVVTHYEADMIVPAEQISAAIKLALEDTGLVVPFTRYEALSPEDSQRVLDGADPWAFEPAHIMDDGSSIGAVGTVSKATIEAIGKFPEEFEGHGFDDNAIFEALETAAGPTRWVKGCARHLWHIPGAGPTPGGKNRQATMREKLATQANRRRWLRYRKASTPAEIRALTSGEL